MSKLWEIVLAAVVSAGLGALGTVFFFYGNVQRLTGEVSELSKAIGRVNEVKLTADVSRAVLEATQNWRTQAM